MCLIITGPSANVRATLLNTQGLIADVFQSNGDGLGVMYKNRKGLRVRKLLPTTIEDVTKFIDDLPQDDRNLAMHWRMRTHGDIDKLNCHPYDVVPGRVALMHNGILHTGNRVDTTKSDTWHFIQDFLASPVGISTDLVHSPGFLKLLEEYIEDNRFVFMDDQGRMSIVNRDQGVAVGPLWFSNTYAWEPSMLISSWRPKTYNLGRYMGGYGGHMGGWGHESDDDDAWDDYAKSRGAGAQRMSAVFNDDERRELFDAIGQYDVDAVAGVLRSWPYMASRALKERFRPSLSEFLTRADADARLANSITKADMEIVNAVMEPTATELGRLATLKPRHVAEILCYYVEWTPICAPSTDATPAANEPDEDSVLDETEDQVLEYRGYTIRLRFDSGIQCWFYDTFDPTGPQVDDGFGYESKLEALRWACDGVDEETAILEDEAEMRDAYIPDEALDAAAEAAVEARS